MSKPLTIAIATDSFKGSLSSAAAAKAFAVGVRRVFETAEIREIPVADGGEGTVDAMLAALGGHLIEIEATGPMGTPVTASYGLSQDGNTAVIEMASASGLTLVPEGERNALFATSYGTGELVLDAAKRGAKRIIIGIGGSATVDGGTGFAQALGVRFFGADGLELPAPMKAEDIKDIAAIDAAHSVPELEGAILIAACDVDNPLVGEKGAARVFGPQKGVSPEGVELLDESLTAYGKLVEGVSGKSLLCNKYTGAGGGITSALHAFFDADLCPGIDLIADVIQLAEQFKDADLVITGEGSIDSQTVYGKTPIGVAKAAKTHGIPVIAIGGQLADDASAVFSHGIEGLESAYVRSLPVATAMAEADTYLANAAERAMRLLQIGRTLGK